MVKYFFQISQPSAWSTDCCTKYHNNMVGMYLTHKSIPFFFCYFYGNFIELDVFLTKKGPPYIEREYFLIRFKS